ncbi:MAG: glucose-6-phosphate isomerase [Zetaproteobacteria bacterium]|nr:glucose-6-phosphate isomerase [Pseudobdellovibrionaceae bacterium]|tara:strand:- start:41 stop:1369 length:1329 start_codon:yes stop_codon:yes gene_type:complete
MKLNLEYELASHDSTEKLDQWLSKGQQCLEDLKNKSCKGSEFLGWFDWPKNHGFEQLEKLEKDKNNYPLHYNLIVVVGIGGSYLGVKAVEESFKHCHQMLMNKPSQHLPIVYLGNNLSESYILEQLEVLDEYEPLVFVVSKSGNTLEPNISFSILEKYLSSRYTTKEANERSIFITNEKDGFLKEKMDLNGNKVYNVPQDVGGRFSVFTAVGLAPLTYAGFDTRSLLQGAHTLFDQINFAQDQSKDVSYHPAVTYASLRRLLWDEGKKMEVMAYSDPKLFSLVEWWKQLFGESEGKNDLGLFPAGVLYSSDLHSLGQYMQQGYPSMIETFLSFDKRQEGNIRPSEERLRVPVGNCKKDALSAFRGHYIEDVNNAAMKAARAAHLDRGIPCCNLSLSNLSLNSIGYLLAFFQVSCAVSALLLNLNPFDQPGVEQYKKKLVKFI